MSHDYEKDLRIIGAATDGPWRWKSYSNSGHEDRRVNSIILGPDDMHIATVWNVSCTCIQGHQYRNQDYIAHFNPSYTKQLVEKTMERDALAERVDELEKALQKVLDDSEIGIVPMSHLEYIKELLK